MPLLSFPIFTEFSIFASVPSRSLTRDMLSSKSTSVTVTSRTVTGSDGKTSTTTTRTETRNDGGKTSTVTTSNASGGGAAVPASKPATAPPAVAKPAAGGAVPVTVSTVLILYTVESIVLASTEFRCVYDHIAVIAHLPCWIAHFSRQINRLLFQICLLAAKDFR